MEEIFCEYPNKKNESKKCGKYLGKAGRYTAFETPPCKDCGNKTIYYKFDITSIHDLEEYGGLITKQLEDN